VTQYANLPELVKQARILREESLDLGGNAKPCYVVEINNRGTEDGGSEKDYPRTLWIEKDRYLVLEEISGTRSESPEFEGMLETCQTLVLSLAKINEELPEDLFVFQPPAGTREIRFASIRQPRRRSLEGEIAKDFTLKDLRGDSVSLKSLRGKVVLLNFWATWCGPCRIEMPQIDHLQKEYRDQGLVVLGITDESPELALKFLAKNQISFSSLTDPEQEVAVQYQVRAIPTIFVIGRDGRIVFQGIGVSREDALRTALKDAGIAAQ
jgi:peroxiredoxin